jgi:hypothetical protein
MIKHAQEKRKQLMEYVSEDAGLIYLLTGGNYRSVFSYQPVAFIQSRLDYIGEQKSNHAG